MKVSMESWKRPNGQPDYLISASIKKFGSDAEITLPTRELADKVLQFVSDVCDAYENELKSLNEDYERLRKALNEEKQKK